AGMLAAREILEEGIAEDQIQADNAVAAAVQETVVEYVAKEAIPSTLLILPSPPSHEQSSPPQQPQSSPQAPPQGVEFPTHLFQQVLDICSALTRRGRMIDDLDKDEGIELLVDQVRDADTAETKGRHAAEQAQKQAEIYHLDMDHPSKVLSMQEDDSEFQEVVEVVTTAKLIT
nr:hypothetical protein [Tanacetum cinerariifolium]